MSTFSIKLLQYIAFVALCVGGHSALAADALKILASDCILEPKDRALTGFALSHTQGIVTALHGVADCGQIVALERTKNISVEMHVVKQSAPRDLALLDLVDPTNRANFNRIEAFDALGANDKIRSGDAVTAIGYPHGILTPQYNDRLQIGRPETERLGDIMGTGNQDLADRKSPDINLSVIKVSGLIVKGESGAPLVLNTAQTRVVGVVIGSADPGSSNIGWVTPIALVEWTAYSAAEWRQRPIPRALASAVGTQSSTGAREYVLVLAWPGEMEIRIMLGLGTQGGIDKVLPTLLANRAPPKTVSVQDKATGAVLGTAPFGQSIKFVDSTTGATHIIDITNALGGVAVGVMSRPMPPTNLRVQ